MDISEKKTTPETLIWICSFYVAFHTFCTRTRILWCDVLTVLVPLDLRPGKRVNNAKQLQFDPAARLDVRLLGKYLGSIYRSMIRRQNQIYIIETN